MHEQHTGMEKNEQLRASKLNKVGWLCPKAYFHFRNIPRESLGISKENSLYSLWYEIGLSRGS